jgi:hypothetical protein
MATRTTTRLHGTRDEAGKSVRAFEAAGGPHADVSVVGSGRDGASGGAGEATTGTGRGAGIGATLGTLLGGGAGLMAGIGALPIPGAGPVVAAGWLVAVLTGAGAGAGVGAAAGGLLGSLTGAGGDEGDAHVHAEAARRDGAALPVRAEEAEAARLEAMAAAGGGNHVDAAPRRTEHEAEGWDRPGPAAPDQTASGVQEERKRRVRVHGGAHADADAEAHRSAEPVQQAGPSAGDAPRRGTEATADAARPGSEARTEAGRRVRVHEPRAAADAEVGRDADAAQQGSRPAGDTPRQDTEVAVDATRRGPEAGAERARRASDATDEAARWDVQAVVGSRRRIAQDPAEPVERASREAAEAARDTAEEARCVAAPPGAAEGGPRGLQQSVAGLAEGAAQANLRVARELFRLADPAPLVDLQQRLAREYTDALLQYSATLVRAARRTADEALRPLERRIERRGGADENEPRAQPAAE